MERVGKNVKTFGPVRASTLEATRLPKGSLEEDVDLGYGRQLWHRVQPTEWVDVIVGGLDMPCHC